ncbi:hypothetical protein J3A64_001773 [Pseudarthrobacter sp. PvP004]|nr:hypothetical protein [Pseudarthrobacter sp. PvP004]
MTLRTCVEDSAFDVSLELGDVAGERFVRPKRVWKFFLTYISPEGFDRSYWLSLVWTALTHRT